MSVLWTDIITPAELSGYARESLAAYEARKGTLARWLPNREVTDTVVRFFKGATGLIDIAKFRAYDAEPEVGRRPKGKRVTLELPALGQELPISEYEQLRARGGTPDEKAVLKAILNTTDQVVQAVADGIELMRGIVLQTGKATIDQARYKSDDDFGRPAGHQLVAGSLWSSSSVSRLDYLQELVDIYVTATGEQPGAIVGSTRIMRALAQGDEFLVQLVNGASRPATEQQVQDTLQGASLPPVFKYDRRVSVGGVAKRVLDDDTLLLLPAPVATDAWQDTDLGATYWGQTLTSMDPDWAIADNEQPGIVVGTYKNPKPPMAAEVVSDAIALPVLANADRSLAAQVL